MTEYYIPATASVTEYTEKRSRFIGRVWPVKSEEEARAYIEQTKKQHHDARHNCWCYLIKEGGILRYSDDGEPQGTAGQPMLEVFRREEITNVCCVVTRYFGGVLLGTGGLCRAYTKSAKDALEAAGVCVVRRWKMTSLSCSYSLMRQLQREITEMGGVIGEPEYGALVTLNPLLPEERCQEFIQHVTQLSAGTIVPAVTGESERAVLLKKP